MSDRPVKVLDVEMPDGLGHRLVAEFAQIQEAVDFIGGIRDKTKVARGGYVIEAPDALAKELRR